MADSGERTPDDNSKEERWLEDRNVTKKQTVRRNLEADYNAAVHTESFKELPRKPTVRKLEFDSYALPLTCLMCKKPYSDPVVTRCSHYFCRHCALEHHEKDNKCFVCKQPTLGVFNTAVEIKQKIAQVRGKAKAMLKEASETMEKASVIMNEAETMKAESAEMVEEVERLVEIAETYGPNLLVDPMWDTVVKMVNNMEDITAKAKDMAEKAAAMMQEANAIVEKGKGEMAKALAMIKNVKWSV